MRSFWQKLQPPDPVFADERSHRHRLPARWTWPQVLLGWLAVTVLSWGSNTRGVWHRVGLQAQSLYFLRVPLFVLMMMTFLPAAAHSRAGKPLLGNLFVELDRLDVVLLTFTTVMTAAAAVAAVNAMLVNGASRFRVPTFGNAYGIPMEVLILVAPAWTVCTVIAEGRVNVLEGTGFALLGLACAIVVLILIRLTQIEHAERMREQPAFATWRLRPLVFPHEISWLDRDPSPCAAPALRWANGILWSLHRRTLHALRLSDPDGPLDRGIEWIAVRFLPERGYLYRPENDGTPRLYSTHRHLILMFLTLAAVLFAFTGARLWQLSLGDELPAWLRYAEHWVPTLAFMSLALWFLTIVLAGITYFLDAYRIPVLASLVVVSVILSIFGVGDDYRYQAFVVPATSAVGLRPHDILGRGTDRPILVAAAGGGIRASAWTARVLSGLAEALPGRFATSVRLLSGVSGGSVGAYYFADAFDETGTVSRGRARNAYRSAVASSLEDIATALVPDVGRFFVPFPLPFLSQVDRGWALERSLALRATHPSATLADWEEDTRGDRRPAAVFNGTLVESGLPIRFATTRFGGGRDRPLVADAVEFRSLRAGVAGRTANIQVATAVRLSATFPFVSPVAASSLKRGEYLQEHVGDGGYYDNFGMMSLMSWLHEGLISMAEDSPSEVLILQIRAGESERRAGAGGGGGWVFQTLAPISTLINMRETAQQIRNDQMLEYLGCFWRERGVRVSTVEIVLPLPNDVDGVDLPLSWRLSTAQARAVEAGWSAVSDDVVDGVRRFVDGAAHPARPVCDVPRLSN